MSSDHIPASLQRRVRERAGNRCEYCRIAQETQEATFHIDHVQPRSLGGETNLANLAVACVSCSLRKGARIAARDPGTQEEVRIFNPRRDVWEEHLQATDDGWFLGVTPIGRVTLDLLRMNRPIAVAIRREAAARGRP